MAKKKVSKKVVSKSKRELPANVTDEEANAIGLLESMDDEEFENMEAGVAFKTEAPIKVAEKNSKKGRNFDIVQISIPVHLKINRKKYNPGAHKVERHLAQTMLEMVDRKRKADVSMFTGKNNLVQRMLDRSLVIKEIPGEIDLAQL